MANSPPSSSSTQHRLRRSSSRSRSRSPRGSHYRVRERHRRLPTTEAETESNRRLHRHTRRRSPSPPLSPSSSTSRSRLRSRSPHRRYRPGRSAHGNDRRREHHRSRSRSPARPRPRSTVSPPAGVPPFQSLALTNQYGSRGVLDATDIFSKSAEFTAWLLDVHGLSRALIDRKREREMFARFAEDFNTATLPHDKYYSLEHWEQQSSSDGPDIRAVSVTHALSDEDRLIVERRALSERQHAAAETFRLSAMKNALVAAKESSASEYQSILVRHQQNLAAQPTFESIAKHREQAKREQSEKARRRYQ